MILKEGSNGGRAWNETLDGAMDEAGVRSELTNLPEGNKSNVRLVSSESALRALFRTLTKGGKRLTSSSGKTGGRVLPDGTQIRYRTYSKSGGHTIDITFPGTNKKWWIHIK